MAVRFAHSLFAISFAAVSLTWKLHFEFVTTKVDEIESIALADSQGVMERSPGEIKVQTMLWDLPLQLLPTHPTQVARGLQLPASSTLTV